MMLMMNVVLASMFVSAEKNVIFEDFDVDKSKLGNFKKLANYLFQTNGSGYHHTWPVSICNIYIYVSVCESFVCGSNILRLM